MMFDKLLALYIFNYKNFENNTDKFNNIAIIN